jgi:hypothetical protein
VPGDPSAAIYIYYWRSIAWQFKALRPFARGINRGMLQEEQCINSFLGDYICMNLSLQFKRLLVIEKTYVFYSNFSSGLSGTQW